MPVRLSRPSNRQGFTLIEVLIVLAIAALILMLVFLLVGTARQGARNYDRKHSAKLVAGQLDEYRSIHGHYPFTDAEAEKFIKDYLQAITNRHTVRYHDNHASHAHIPPPDTITFQAAHWCNRYGNGDQGSDPVAGNDVNVSKYVVWTQLEPLSLTKPNIFCIDNYGQ